MAILLVPLIAILGLVIDSSLILGAKNDLQTKINQAALAGIANYLNVMTNPSGICTGGQNIPQCAAKQGLLRAESIATVNLTLGEKFTQNGQGTPISDFGSAPSEAASEGSFELGKYYWEQPCSGDEGSCNPCSGVYPCFVPRDDGLTDNNAVRLTAKFKDSNKIKTFFMHLLGMSSVGMTINAVATVLPSNQIFLLDLSQSTVEDSYKMCGVKSVDADGNFVDQDPGPDCPSSQPACAPSASDPSWAWCLNRRCSLPHTRAEFAFELDPNSFTSDSLSIPEGQTAADVLESICSTSVGDQSNNSSFNGFASNHCYICEGDPYSACAIKPRDFGPFIDPLDYGLKDEFGLGNSRPSPSSRYEHYRNEYRCRVVKGIYPDPKDTMFFLVDYGKPPAGLSSGNPYGSVEVFEVTRPAPLFDLISAAHKGMEILKERGLTADRFGFMGFDESFCFPDSSENCDYGTEGTTFIDGLHFSARHLPLSSINLAAESNFNKFLTATDLSISNIGFSKSYSPEYAKRDFISRGLFPLKGFTDIHGALQRALWEIVNRSDSTFKYGKNSIFLFTDGFANCYYTLQGGNFVKEGCNNFGSNVINSISAITSSDPDQLVARMKKARVSVSVALVGKSAGPHIVIRRAPNSTSCLDQVTTAQLAATSDSQSILVDTSFTFADGSEGSFPYSQFTNGEDREAQLNLATINAIVDGENHPFYAPNYLYQGLVLPTRGLWCPLLPTLTTTPDASGQSTNVTFASEIEQACSGDGSDNSQLGPPIANITTNGVSVTDDKGRLLYDPYGRSIEEQLEDCIKLALQSPYVLAP